MRYISMKRAIFVVLLVYALTATAGCLDGIEQKSDSQTMTINEIMDNYKDTVDNDSNTVTSWLVTLDEGDAVIIRDEVHALSTHEKTNVSWTDVTFSSFINFSLPIDGNISGEFEPGDMVELRLHITNVTFTRWNPDTNETWTFNFETFKEGWDNEQHRMSPIPRTYLYSVE
ncbi:MAG: hypothetical protein ACP5FL_07480 [Thermoplasmatota archaeon]